MKECSRLTHLNLCLLMRVSKMWKVGYTMPQHAKARAATQQHEWCGANEDFVVSNSKRDGRSKEQMDEGESER